MLISIEEYLEENGVYQMSLNELLAFKDKIYDTIKGYEDDKYTDRLLEQEMFMHPSPSVHYCWNCDCLIMISRIILMREDVNDQLKEKCSREIYNTYEKIDKGLYDNDDTEVLNKYFTEHFRGNRVPNR